MSAQTDEDHDPGPGVAKNANLSNARKAKNDEFYTQWVDIEREINAYLEYDPDVFRDKVVLLPCDDPDWSNFTKYFALHFAELGLMKLISTSYAADSKPREIPYQPSLLEAQDPGFDPVKTRANGKKFVLERKDLNEDGVINLDDLRWEYLEGDGDFRSDEVTALRDEAHIVVTNPPFSLFREFLGWLMEGDVQFSVIANKNAVTYKEVFPLIKANRLWCGVTPMSADLLFHLPASSAAALQASSKEGSAWKRVDGEVMGRASALWLTNIEHGRRHTPLTLMTEADNIKFSKHKQVKGVGYQQYENYNAIEVPFTDAIPADHDGIMGVPISFLDKYCPEQFEILWQATGNTRASAPQHVLTLLGYVANENDRGGCGVVDGARVYSRIFIRRKGDQ